MRIVQSFNKIEEGQSCLGLDLEPASVKEFACQSGKETLTQGVVKAISERTGGRPNFSLIASFPEDDGSIPTSLIGMMNHQRRTALPQCHLRPMMHSPHRPSNDSPRNEVHYRIRIEKPCPCREVDDISYPKSIGCRSEEGSLYQIRDNLRLCSADGRPDSLMAANTLQSSYPDKMHYALPTYPKSLLNQFKMNPKHPMGLAEALLKYSDPPRQHGIGLCPHRRHAILPQMTSTGC